MTEDQVEELMKAFAQADKVTTFTIIVSETFVGDREYGNHIIYPYLRMVMEFSQLRSTRQLSMNTESLLVGKPSEENAIRLFVSRRGMDPRNDGEN